MFTGIIEETGTVRAISPKLLTVNAGEIFGDLKPGDSISINGVCLTVTDISGKTFTVDLMPETQRRTSFGTLRSGDEVNLERALQPNGRLGGHFVQGHVDGKGRILSMIPEGDAVIMRISVEEGLTRYMVEKGFIAVDGVSLTIIDYDSTSFAVSLVGFTRKKTILGNKKPGKEVNIEVDILAKYIEKYSKSKNKDEVLLSFLEG